VLSNPVADHSTWPFTASSQTSIARIPLHGSTKPLQRARKPTTLAMKRTSAPDTSTTVVAPPLGATQQYVTPADDATCCSPAQLLARTARW